MEPGNAREAVERNEGTTDTERYLQQLCERSFLSLWSYSGLYRNRKTGGRGDGKELCDLLVVFGDDILFFRTRIACSAIPAVLPLTGADGSRFKEAIMKSAVQAWGAERWIRGFPKSIFLDRGCTRPFPLPLPPVDRMRIHHIVVAHEIADKVVTHFGGGSGSLIFNSDFKGCTLPFNVG